MCFRKPASTKPSPSPRLCVLEVFHTGSSFLFSALCDGVTIAFACLRLIIIDDTNVLLDANRFPVTNLLCFFSIFVM